MNIKLLDEVIKYVKFKFEKNRVEASSSVRVEAGKLGIKMGSSQTRELW